MAGSERRILIHSHGERGHIGPTFKTAEKLRARGDHVIYLAEVAARDLVESEGYEFVPYLRDVYMADAKVSTTLDWCLAYQKNIMDELVSGRLEKLLAPLKLDLIMHDTTRAQTGWLARSLGIPYLRVNTSFPNSFDPAVPPTWSDALPGDLSFQQIYREWQAFDALIYRKPRLRSPLAPSHKEYYEWLERFGFEISQLRPATTTDVMDGDPELILTSKSLDFPSPNRPPEWVYAGPCLRPDNSPDWNPPGRRTGAPLVVCAFGGQASSYPQLMRLLACLLDVFARRPDLDVVIAGPATDLPLPSSVCQVEWIPQRAVLRQADLFITHGGLSSLKEAVWEGVPLLACPQAWDQHGNAARIVYHGVGERVLDQCPTAASVGKQIDELLSNPSFKCKAAALGETLRAENDSDEDLRMIDHVLSGELKPFSREQMLELEDRILKGFLG